MKLYERKSMGRESRQSFGIICQRATLPGLPPEYLIVRRKYSIGFEEIIRSKWELTNFFLLRELFNNMTLEERELTRTMNYGDYFDLLNLDRHGRITKDEAVQKFETLKRGYHLNWGLSRVVELPPDASDSTICLIDLESILKSCLSKWTTPPTEFPKGRREDYEDNKKCAQREFKEETNLNPSQYRLLDVAPVRERFTGMNGFKYSYTYYLAKMISSENDQVSLQPQNVNQTTELSWIGWATSADILKLIRYENFKRKDAFRKALVVFEPPIIS